MRKIDSIVDSGECTGCMACHSLCPRNAIEVREGRDGFLYPEIRTDKCIDCGICLKHCPSNAKRGEIQNTTCFAAQMDDETRFASSSGGMFSAIGSYILSQGGVVCGAAFVNGKCRHIVVDNADGMKSLRKSKYIQSDCTGVYEQLRPHLESGKPVLFTGTPCQCAAVRAIYPNASNLFVVDILCMGVPSQSLFDRYLREEMPGDHVDCVDFRDKTRYGWTYNYVMSLFRNGNRELIEHAESPFFDSFLDLYSIRESCTECPYAGKKRIGDLSIGDFWGIESVDNEITDRKGTSLLLVNTEKGRYLLDAIRGSLKLLREYSMDVAFRATRVLQYPAMVSSKRREFFERLENGTVREAYDSLKSNKADCGIINYWWSNGIGNVLTAFALQRLLQQNGYSSRLINICPDDQYARRSGKNSSEFERKYLYSTEQITSAQQFQKLNDSFTHFITGSDQVFRAEWVSNRWFLDFVELSHNKIAMSASFGTGVLSVNKLRKLQVRFLLRRFNSISIRELSGVRLCKRLGVEAEYVIDPVFLIDPQNYMDIIPDSTDRAGSKRYVLGYYLDTSKEKLEQIESVATYYGLDVVLVDNNTPHEEFLYLMSHAEYVLTDSFHGLCFSLIFKKEYACYFNKMRGNDRFETLIEILELSPKRFLSENEGDSALKALQCPNDWEKVNRNILIQREKGVKWLMNALQNPGTIDQRKLRKAERNKNLLEFMHKLRHNRVTRKVRVGLSRIKRMVMAQR